jgi:poly(3-hydroxybutyrate) depolymerase
MRLIFLLLVGLVMADVADAQRRTKRQRVIRGVHGEVLNRNGDFETAVGGNASSSLTGMRVSTGLLPKGVYEIALSKAVTGSGWEERFLVGVPTNPIVPAPCLVVFHGYGEEHTHMVSRTSYFQEAMARGWVVVAPLGAHKYNYAIGYAQENVLSALTWAATYLMLDPDRFYAVGFSMGGGMAASFAARHLDPNGPQFAAVAVHTGSCSVRDVYWNSNDQALFEHPQMFGSNPDARPFRYQRASTIDLDTFTNTVDRGTDMVRNLVHAPIYHFAALNDPVPYLVNETEKNHEQALLHGGDTTLVISDDSVHKWSTLDEAVILDWFEPKTHQVPSDDVFTRVLADRTGHWYGIHVRGVSATAFTPFRWKTMLSLNRMVIDEVENADRVSFDPSEHGLDKGSAVELLFQNVDGLAVDLVLEGYSQAPSDVWRGGGSTGSWSYDPVAETVTLFETNGANWPKWTVFP